MTVLIVAGYIVGYAFLLAFTYWIAKWCAPIVAGAFRSVFKRK